MTEESEGKTIREYAKMITKDTCTCGAKLDTSHGNIKRYPHPGGWLVRGFFFSDKQWLYIHCDKCGYDLALWKLGVDR